MLAQQIAGAATAWSVGGDSGGSLGADLPAGSGDDTLIGGSGSDRLSGFGGNDLIYGDVGDDTLSGGPGEDSLEGGRGNDLIEGGDELDTLVFDHSSDGAYANLETGHVISFSSLLGEDTVTGVENAIGTSFNDALYGDAVGNRFSGRGGNDTLFGGRADDTLTGDAGADSINGGDDNDLIVGGAGADVLSGGDGLDIFEVSSGDSPWLGLVTERDLIKDFSDILLLRGGVAPTSANYIEAVYSRLDPRAHAQELYAMGYEYIAIQVGAHVEFYAPRIGVGVIFEHGSIDVIDLINFRVAPASLPPPPVPTLGGDVLTGSGNDTIDGLAGADTITGGAGRNYLRGGEGADSIVGGAGFDDINGNAGNDTCVSGGGDDWVVGGKDNDSLTGSAGQNLVYGNLGADTCEGGDGNDVVRGGQDNDIVRGGSGDDYVSGDKGDDTVTGGSGADVFHTFGDAGIDRVLDFNRAEGDRVLLDPGTQYSVAQVGADTVISMTGGGRMVLVGVQLSVLTSDWIFGG